MTIQLIESKRDYRRWHGDDGSLLQARRTEPGVWLVTAHSADVRAEVQGTVWFNEAGFRGRQWESNIDGQQYASLTAAAKEALNKAVSDAAFARTIERLRADGLLPEVK